VPIGDWLDLVVQAPAFLFFMLLIHRRFQRKAASLSNLMSIVGMIIFFYGHAMHLVGKDGAPLEGSGCCFFF
jgi:hypothetical protein